MLTSIQEGKYFDDKGRTITVSDSSSGMYFIQVDDNIRIMYRDKKSLIKDLRKMSKTYKAVQ